MDEFRVGDSELLKFALSKFNITKEELETEYKERRVELEDIRKHCNDFKSYCNNTSCSDCEIYKFKKDNNLRELSASGCILLYDYLFKKGMLV